MNWKDKYYELKIGSKVTIRKDLKFKTYGSFDFIEAMVSCMGKTMTINEVCKNSSTLDIHYRLQEYPFNWTKEMFEGGIE